MKIKKVSLVVALSIVIILALVFFLCNFYWNNSIAKKTKINTLKAINIEDFKPKSYNEDTFLIFYSLLDKHLHPTKGKFFLVKQVDKNNKNINEYIVQINGDYIDSPSIYENYMDKNTLYLAPAFLTQKQYIIKYNNLTQRFEQIKDTNAVFVNFIGKSELYKTRIDDKNYIVNTKDSSKILLKDDNALIKLHSIAEFNDAYVVNKLGDKFINIYNKFNKDNDKNIYTNKFKLFYPYIIKYDNDKLIILPDINKLEFFSMDKNYNLSQLFSSTLGKSLINSFPYFIGANGELAFPYYVDGIKKNAYDNINIGIADFNNKTVTKLDKAYIKSDSSYMPLYVDYNKNYVYILETSPIKNKPYVTTALKDNSDNKYKYFTTSILVLDAKSYDLITTLKLENDGLVGVPRAVICINKK